MESICDVYCVITAGNTRLNHAATTDAEKPNEFHAIICSSTNDHMRQAPKWVDPQTSGLKWFTSIKKACLKTGAKRVFWIVWWIKTSQWEFCQNWILELWVWRYGCYDWLYYIIANWACACFAEWNSSILQVCYFALIIRQVCVCVLHPCSLWMQTDNKFVRIRWTPPSGPNTVTQENQHGSHILLLSKANLSTFYYLKDD